MTVPIETERVWHQLHDGLLAFVRRRVDGEQEAEDVLQEVFVRIHANLGSLNDTESLHAWVYRLTRNAIADYYRRRARTDRVIEAVRVYAIEEPLPAGSDPLTEPDPDLEGCVAELIGELPESYAEALRLTERGELTQQEAAERLGLSVSGMKSRVQRGRKQLEVLLGRCCHFEFDRRRSVIDYEPLAGGDCADCDCQAEPSSESD
jgi:RNA polymerase sigma-70 factor (ECF subfamily)